MKISEGEKTSKASLERIIDYGMSCITGTPTENPYDILTNQEIPDVSPDYRFSLPLHGIVEKTVTPIEKEEGDAEDEQRVRVNFRPVSPEDLDKEEDPVRVFEISSATTEYLAHELSERMFEHMTRYAPSLVTDEEREAMFPVQNGMLMLTKEGKDFIDATSVAMIAGILQSLPAGSYHRHEMTGFEIPNLKGRINFYYTPVTDEQGKIGITDLDAKERLFTPEMMVPLFSRTADLEELEDLDEEEHDNRLESITKRWASMAIIAATIQKENNPRYAEMYKELPKAFDIEQEPEYFLEMFLTEKGYEMLLGEDGNSGPRRQIQEAMIKEFERLEAEEGTFDYLTVEWDEEDRPYITTSRFYTQQEKKGLLAITQEQAPDTEEGVKSFIERAVERLEQEVMRQDVERDEKYEATLKLRLQEYLPAALYSCRGVGDGEGIMSVVAYQTDKLGNVMFIPYREEESEEVGVE